MSIKSSRSFSSLLEGSFLGKSKKNLNHGSDNSLEFKSSFGFVVKDFDGDVESSELSCSKGDQVSILASINEHQYLCKNTTGKIGIIPTNYLNLDTVSKYEIPNFKEYKAEAGTTDNGFVNFLYTYDNKPKARVIENRTRSISQPTMLEIKVGNILAAENSVKVGTLQKSDNLIVSVIGDDEIKKIIIKEAWNLSDINIFVFKKFKISEIEKYQLFVLNHNNNMVSLNDFLLTGLRNDTKTEKNIYLRKRHSSKSKLLSESSAESSPNLQVRSISKTGSFMGKSKKNISPGFTTTEVKTVVALLIKEFKGKGTYYCNKGDQVTILAVIDARFYVCRKSNELIDAIPVELLYIQNSKIEIPTIEQYQKNNSGNNDPNFSEFYLQYAGNNFIDSDSDAETPKSVFRNARKRSRSQPMSLKSNYGDLKFNGFSSVKAGKTNNLREPAKLITFNISGDNGESKKVVIDSDFTLIQSVALIYEAFDIKESHKYQLLIIDNSSPTELNDKIFARLKSDPLYVKPLYLKKKPNPVEKLEPIESEIETSTPTSNSLTPPTRESALSNSSSVVDSLTMHRSSTDTTSSISSNADSIFNGMIFRVVNKGVRGPPIPNLNEVGVEIHTIVKGRLLGKGNSASVYLGMNSKTGKSIAIKEIDLSLKFPTSVHKNTVLEVLKRETLFLHKLQHEHIVEYYGFNLIDDKLQLLLECVPGGSIQSMIANYGKFPDALVINFSKEILLGLEYLHHKHILHRDIKSSNLLVDDKGHCKLTDFGYAVTESKKSHVSFIDESYLRNSEMQSSVYWMAPEVVMNLFYSSGSDIWAFSCVVIEMFTSELPYGNDVGQIEALFKIGKSMAPPLPVNISPQAIDMLEKGLSLDYKVRPSASTLLRHPYLKKVLKK